MITHAEIKANIRKKYEENMKDMTKEEKIKYLEDCKFNIDMIDRWSQEDEFYYDVVCKLLREVKDEEENKRD